MTIETTIRIWREGEHYVAHALPIDVSSAGDTPESARKALLEAVELFVATARQHGTLDEVLEECAGVNLRYLSAMMAGPPGQVHRVASRPTIRRPTRSLDQLGTPRRR